MNMSFYVGAIGAGSCTEKLSVISNNLANVNNTGFKPKSAVFSELINYNLNDSPEAVTELQAGAGIRVQRTSTGFDVGGLPRPGASMTTPLHKPMPFSWSRTRKQENGYSQGTATFTGENGTRDSIL